MSVSFIVIVTLQVQCNVFKGVTGEVALTAAGGLRQLPGLTENYENAALVLSYEKSSNHISPDFTNTYSQSRFPLFSITFPI